MKDKIMIILKGFVFGLANIIPGVSGGTIALTMGIYEDLISSISNILKSFKKSMSLLIPFGIGALLSIVLLSKIINFTLTKYPAPTILFFIGLILGGIPLLTKNIKGKKVKPRYILLFLTTFSFILLLTYLGGAGHSVKLTSSLGSYILLFIVGMIAAATMVIPGVSGSFVMMLLGYYQPIINTIDELTSMKNVMTNILILIPLGLGIVVGIIGISKLIEFLFKKYKIETYYAILGFILASIITLFISITFPHSIIQILIGIILLIIGTFCGYKLGDS